MKNIIILLLVCSVQSIYCQIDVGGMVKNKVNQRIEQKANQAIDKTLDETERNAKEAAKGNKKGKAKKDGQGSTNSEAEEGAVSDDQQTSSSTKKSLTTYSKFDFIPGEKVLIVDQFENVAVGDFPADWNTNGTGEIVTAEGYDSKWIQINKEGVFMPDYITDLPENFTMQFDVMVNEDFDFYSNGLQVTFLSTANRAKLNAFGRFSSPGFGTRFTMHPTSAGNAGGNVVFENWDKDGNDILSNNLAVQQFHAATNNFTKVSVWRQKQRLRVYFNDEKVLDIPRAFDAAAKYNAFTFGFGGGHHSQDKYLIANLRLAVGAPDTRSKLITEGKLVTRGILFDVASDKIKPESYGTLKDIANVLKENPEVKVQIVGHTDADGEDTANLELSKKRSLAVKKSLETEFGIDPTRLSTDGKGESQPVDSNTNTVGKANNRRVEFIKI
jgi:OmpA-OmpF porin, OOP family